MAIAGQACGSYVTCGQCIDDALTESECVWCHNSMFGFCRSPDTLCPALFGIEARDECPIVTTASIATTTAATESSTTTMTTTTDNDLSQTTADADVPSTTSESSPTTAVDAPNVVANPPLESDMTWLYALIGALGCCCLLLSLAGALLMRRKSNNNNSNNNNNHNYSNNSDDSVAPSSSSLDADFTSVRDDSLSYGSVSDVVQQSNDTNVCSCHLSLDLSIHLSIDLLPLSIYLCLLLSHTPLSATLCIVVGRRTARARSLQITRQLSTTLRSTIGSRRRYCWRLHEH
jgi:hypothetical protein